MLLRFKAFLTHLAISLLIALIAAFIVFKVWYPSPLQLATGVTTLFLMLLIIDVILGPILTLLVYKPGKKTLVMDLTVIACLQIAALAYGLHSVADGRPAWIAFAADRFELVRVPDIDTEHLGKVKHYQTAPWTGPEWVTAQMPFDLNARNNITIESVLGGTDIHQRPALYQPIERAKESIQRQAQSLDQLNNFNPADQVQKILTNHPTATAWLPLKANHQDMTVLINKKTADVVAIVDLRPWD